MNDTPTEPLRPLLLLAEDEKKKALDATINITDSFLRSKSSLQQRNRPNPFLNLPDVTSQQPPPTPHRVNPLLTMLSGRPASSNVYRRQQTQSYDSPSSYSLPSPGAPGSRKLIQGKFIPTHKKADLDALYRMALQNQTAYKAVEHTRIENRKLHDKEFASKHRALMGSMRSSGLVN